MALRTLQIKGAFGQTAWVPWCDFERLQVEEPPECSFPMRLVTLSPEDVFLAGCVNRAHPRRPDDGRKGKQFCTLCDSAFQLGF